MKLNWLCLIFSTFLFISPFDSFARDSVDRDSKSEVEDSARGDRLLNYRDLSMLFPKKMAKKLIEPRQFLTKKQLIEISSIFGVNINICIAGIRLDPAAEMVGHYEYERIDSDLILPKVKGLDEIPSFRVIIQSCDFHFDVVAHALLKVTKTEIYSFLKNIVNLRGEFGVDWENQNELSPRNDLDQISDDHRRSYLERFNAILWKILNPRSIGKSRIHRIASIKTKSFRTWAFRAIDIVGTKNNETHQLAVIPNVANQASFLKKEYFNYFQQSIRPTSNTARRIKTTTRTFSPLLVNSNFFQSLFDANQFKIDSEVPLQKFIGFPTSPNSLFAETKVRGVRTFGTAKKMVEPIDGRSPVASDCLSCHVAPKHIKAPNILSRDNINTGHFRWFKGKPTISFLVYKETKFIYEEIAKIINSRISAQ